MLQRARWVQVFASKQRLGNGLITPHKAISSHDYVCEIYGIGGRWTIVHLPPLSTDNLTDHGGIHGMEMDRVKRCV